MIAAALKFAAIGTVVSIAAIGLAMSMAWMFATIWAWGPLVLLVNRIETREEARSR